MTYATERAEARERLATFRTKPQEIATVQSSFRDMAEPGSPTPKARVRRPARRVDTSLRQLTFADIDEAWV